MAASLLRQSSTSVRSLCLPQVTGINKCLTRHFDDEAARRRDGKHPETPANGVYEDPPPKGKIYDKKPFPVELEAGKKYAWCTCGHSRQQPFCDGTHHSIWEQNKRLSYEKKFLPHRFTVKETKKYWLCLCKQTDNRPFCDGTHKNPEIQAKIRT